MNPDTDIHCLACRSERLKVVARLGGGRHQIVRCLECSLEFVSPILASDLNAEDDNSTITDQTYIMTMKTGYNAVRDLVQTRARNRIGLYTRLLGGQRPQRILEVGCGAGWMVHALSSLGVETAGLEVDDELVEFATTLGADVRCGDICRIVAPISPNYDVVFASQVVEHILSPQLALENMARLLRPGGIVHIDVPNADCWGARIRRLRHGDTNWGVISLPHHQIGYYSQSLRGLLQRSGLNVLEIMERPTDDEIFGQTILPQSTWSRMAMRASRYLGHGYLLIGLAQKPQG